MHYRLNEFAKLLNVSTKTLQRWDKEGILIAYRTPSDRRYYTHEQYLSYIGGSTANDKLTIIYARVSSNGQKDDLVRQIEFLQTYVNAKGMIAHEVIQDIGSGLNYNRKNWNNLLERVMNHEIETIVISHRDRFIRFGYEWFEKLCSKFGTKILVVQNESLSPQEELVQDIISILHVFSCRIYGLRKYKKQIKEDIDIDKSIQDGSNIKRQSETEISSI